MNSKQWEGLREECLLPHISSGQSAQEEECGARLESVLRADPFASEHCA